MQNSIEMENIKLESSDKEIFEVDLDTAKCSVLVRDALELLRNDDENGQEVIVPVANVNSEVLKKVIEFCNHHKLDLVQRSAIDAENTEVVISAWDEDFLNVDQTMIFQLIEAANYMDIPNLMDVTSKTIADRYIMNKSVEEIRKTFDITNDLTPEEEEQIRIENSWCEEK